MKKECPLSIHDNKASWCDSCRWKMVTLSFESPPANRSVMVQQKTARISPVSRERLSHGVEGASLRPELSASPNELTEMRGANVHREPPFWKEMKREWVKSKHLWRLWAPYVWLQPPMNDCKNWFSEIKQLGIWSNLFIFSRLWTQKNMAYGPCWTDDDIVNIEVSIFNF